MHVHENEIVPRAFVAMNISGTVSPSIYFPFFGINERFEFEVTLLQLKV